ncbi:uncharacterized protein LOC142322209 [Lycorma delicatula]|uniref:uncharacterized protein LOC142322209 n=1 Tax=Lycorma delicatula TaxID=130591 RepID=UPI003F5155CE
MTDYTNCGNGVNSMYEIVENRLKCVSKRDVLNSEVRKFFFYLHDREVERDLRVSIAVVTDDESNEQIILIELTNDNSPIFLFILSITKPDFEILRNDQNINIAFNDFPRALINLLDKCTRNPTDSTDRGGTFKPMLEGYCGTVIGGSLMDMKKIKMRIIEECSFKNICHLTLEFMRATEAQVRQKLETEVFKMKQQLLQTSKLYEEALKNISLLEDEINLKNKNIENLNDLVSDMKYQKEEEWKKEQKQAECREKELCDKYEEKIRQAQQIHQNQYEKMQLKTGKLEEELKNCNEHQHELQSLIYEKEKDCEVMEAELITAKLEISQLRSQNAKLDSDYHDKEKTVNILRTRLAVAEQELKDNNTVLLNHKEQLAESSKEKSNWQERLDFIQKKLEKKESTVLNLSEELLKANEIISKQQSKLGIFSMKLKDSEQTILKKEKVIEEKEADLLKKTGIMNKLQDELNKVSKELLSLNDKLNGMENELKEKDKKIKTSEEIINMIRENIKDHNSEFKSNLIQQPLLFHRTFLSMPSLLPSDYCRRLNELWNPLLTDRNNKVDCNIRHDTGDFIKTVGTSNVTQPYILRISDEFQSVPVLFKKSSDNYRFALKSPYGLEISQPVYNIPLLKSYRVPASIHSHENINFPAEYTEYYQPNKGFPTKVASESSINNFEEVHLNQQEEDAKCETNESDAKSINFGLGEHKPRYTHVGGFRLRPILKSNNSASNSNKIAKLKFKNNETVSKITKVRKTPAIAAPPLTPEQRENIDLVLKASRRQPQNLQDTKKFNGVSSDNSGIITLSGSSYTTGPPWKPKGLIPEVSYITDELHVTSNTSSSRTLEQNDVTNKEETEPSAYFIA